MERTNELTKTFEMNSKAYRCTAEVLTILNKAQSGQLSDETAKIIFNVGIVTGAIVETS